MSKILVQTGFGYYKNQAGDIVSKAELPAGNHDLANGFVYIEVQNKSELDAIEIWQDPAILQQHENEQKIRTKMRQLAIDALKAAGDLPAD
ncbi:MAG: hypothetical protein FVQ80_15275, partial [Planctomycetes bacterium]|nr:hypothetical protein [Planctomycetota bacterium]